MVDARRLAHRSVLGIVLWLALGAGLVGMHGLGDHGSMSPVASSAAMPGMDHSDVGHGSDPGMPAMAGMCLAFLALGLALLASGRRGLLVLRLPLRRADGGLLAVRARPRDPPDLFRLSIQRC